MSEGALPDDDLAAVCDAARDAFESLRGARIFLTGATGFFGAWLLESFARAVDTLALDARAVVLTRDPEAFLARRPRLRAHAAIAFLRGDVRSYDPPVEPFTHVVHAATASSASPTEVTPEGHIATIVDGTRRVLQHAHAAGARRLLYVSSGAVYGRQPPDVTHVSETFQGAPDPLEPGASYGLAKRLAEHLCVLAGRAGGPAAVIARGFAFSGPGLPLDAHFAFGNFVRDGLAGRPIRVNGDGTAVRSYLYGADLAAWLWTLLARGAPGAAYNVGAEDALSVRELASAVAAHFGVAVEVAGVARPGVPPARYVPSTARIRGELEVTPRVGLADAIARTARWHGYRGPA